MNPVVFGRAKATPHPRKPHAYVLLAARFWRKVDTSGECWEWTASRGRGGYGTFVGYPTTRRAHRVAWMLTRGPIPAGWEVCHHCDNPPCVRPEHLFVGTRKDNMEDAKRKGRISHGESHRVALKGLFKGGGNGHAKLTEADVRAIRSLRCDGLTFSEIGRRYGVTRTCIQRVVTGQRWAHVEDDL